MFVYASCNLMTFHYLIGNMKRLLSGMRFFLHIFHFVNQKMYPSPVEFKTGKDGERNVFWCSL